MKFNYLYNWDNLEKYSPQEDVRNEWLWYYGAFGKHRDTQMWFPLNILMNGITGNPAVVAAVPIATTNMTLYPSGQISAADMEVIYSVFPDGMSLQAYGEKEARFLRIIDTQLEAANFRALDTAIVAAPKERVRDVKRAANRSGESKGEVFVVSGVSKDEVFVVEMPSTVDIIEELWNGKDWAVQELSQIYGIAYNPSQGKKERVIQQEMLSGQDLTIMNRRKLTNRLKRSAQEFGESVVHISDEMDIRVRNLDEKSERLVDKNVDGENGSLS